MRLGARAYKFYRERTLLVVLGLFVIGGLLVWASWEITSDDWKAIVLSFGVGAISLGAYTATSEYFLKTALTDDLLEKIEIKSQILRTGFNDARPEREFSWNEWLRGADSTSFVVAHPGRFSETVWPHIYAASRDSSQRTEIFLPRPAVVATVLPDGTSQEKFVESDPSFIAAKRWEDAWSKGKSSKTISGRSSLRIAFSSRPVSISVASTELRSVLILDSIEDPGGHGFALQFKSETGPDSVGNWVTQFVKEVAHGAEDSWNDTRKKGNL